MDFELVSPTRVRVRGTLTEDVVNEMGDDADIRSLQEAEFAVEKYFQVALKAPDGARFIPPPVLQSVLSEERLWNEELTPAKLEKTWEKNVAPKLTEEMRSQLKKHQKEGIVKALLAERYMIADDMGLGKTASAIACVCWVLRTNPEARVLVVCPPKLREQWADEFVTWTASAPIKTRVRRSGDEVEVEEKDPEEKEEVPEEKEDENAPVTIVGYSVANNPACRPLFLELFGEGARPFDFVVMDETHDFFGSDTSLVTEHLVLDVDAPLKKAERVLLLTGSPSGPRKLYSQLQALFPDSFSVQEFEEHYCGGRTDPGTGQWDASRVTHAEELHVWFSRRMVRRMKEKELKHELPEQITEKFFLDLPPAALGRYRALEIQRRNLLGLPPSSFNSNKIKLLTNEMYRALTEAKLPACKQWIQRVAKEQWEAHKQKTAVFTHHEKARQTLAKWFAGQGAVTISGTTPEKLRLKRIKALRSESDTETRLGLLSNKACGAGINLAPAVTTIVIVEQDYSEAVDAQVKDRIYRIGAKHKCRIVYLLAKGTMDETIFEKVDEKFAASSAVVGGISKKRRIDTEADAFPEACVRSGRESLENFLERAGVRGTLGDAFQVGLVDATRAAVAMAAEEPVDGSTWYEVPVLPAAGGSGPPPPVAEWMRQVECRITTREPEHVVAQIAGLSTGLERFREVLRKDTAAGAYVRRRA